MVRDRAGVPLSSDSALEPRLHEEDTRVADAVLPDEEGSGEFSVTIFKSIDHQSTGEAPMEPLKRFGQGFLAERKRTFETIETVFFRWSRTSAFIASCCPSSGATSPSPS